MKYKILKPETVTKIESSVKSLLHASRDCMRNQNKDTNTLRFCINDGYYGEAFGILKCLEILGYGYFGDSCTPGKDQLMHSLKWWFEELSNTVLMEENFGESNECDHCIEMWGKDGAGRTRDDTIHLSLPRGENTCGKTTGTSTSQHLEATCPTCIELHQQYENHPVPNQIHSHICIRCRKQWLCGESFCDPEDGPTNNIYCDDCEEDFI